MVPIKPKHCPNAAKIKSVCASGIEMIFACNPYPVNPALPNDNNAVYNWFELPRMLLSGSNHASILCSLYEDINEARILGYSKYKNKKVPTTITIKAKIPIIYSLRIPLQQTKMKILNTIIIQTPVSGCIIIKNNGGE